MANLMDELKGALNNGTSTIIGGFPGQQQTQQAQQQTQQYAKPTRKKKRKVDAWTKAIERGNKSSSDDVEELIGCDVQSAVVYTGDVESTKELVKEVFTTTLVVVDTPTTDVEKKTEEMALYLMSYPVIDISTVGAIMAITVDGNGKSILGGESKLPIKFVGKFTILFYRNIHVMKAFIMNIFDSTEGDIDKIGPKAMANILTGMGDVIIPTDTPTPKLARIWHPASKAFRFDSGSSLMGIYTKARRTHFYNVSTTAKFIDFIIGLCKEYKVGYVDIEDVEVDTNALTSYEDMIDADNEYVDDNSQYVDNSIPQPLPVNAGYADDEDYSGPAYESGYVTKKNGDIDLTKTLDETNYNF